MWPRFTAGTGTLRWIEEVVAGRDLHGLDARPNDFMGMGATRFIGAARRTPESPTGMAFSVQQLFVPRIQILHREKR